MACRAKQSADSSYLVAMTVDAQNRHFQAALFLARDTRENIFLTGKAGTGKTTFLRYIQEELDKTILTVAPTGVAAINAGGMTIHSLFQIAPGVYPPDDARLQRQARPDDPDRTSIFNHFRYGQERKDLLQRADMIVIDEVSMVRCDLLDTVDVLLRTFGGNRHLPFGGKQLLFIGDAFQLPPVARDEDWEILAPHYDSPFFFSARSFRAAQPRLIELQKIYRQSDRRFVDLLNRVRVDQPTEEDLATLNDRLAPRTFDYAQAGYIYLATRNRDVQQRNRAELAKIDARRYCFRARVEGDFKDNEMPTLEELELKVGAQVMFVKNDTGEERRYFNGKLGRVTEIDEDTIKVECPPPPDSAETEARTIDVQRAEWQKIRYYWDEEKRRVEEEVTGSFVQFPLRLAWAITVHKSQGLTFEKVFADLWGAFASGQTYVALSRCTSLAGLRLATSIRRRDIQTDPRVLDFARSFSDDREIEAILEQLEFASEAEQLDYYLENNRLVAALQMYLELKANYTHLPLELMECERRLVEALRAVEEKLGGR
jgi:YD repeat-containing protein